MLSAIYYSTVVKFEFCVKIKVIVVKMKNTMIPRLTNKSSYEFFAVFSNIVINEYIFG